MSADEPRFVRNAAASAGAPVPAPTRPSEGGELVPHAPLVGEIDDAPVEAKPHHPFVAEMRRNHAAQVALGFLVLLVLVAVFAPLVAPYDPNRTDIRSVFSGPWSEGHLLGTDHVGRDILSRLIFGARTSLIAAVEAVAIATAIGVPLGLIAGYFGGPVDSIFSRMNDALTSVPALMLALTVVAILGPGLGNAMIAVGIVSVPRTFRVTRAAVLEVRHSTFIEASVALGLKRRRVVLVHVLPNAVSPLLVIISVSLGFAVLAEAALSYLGFGVQPPTPSWGGMLSDASRSLNRKYLVYAPGILLALTIAAFTVMADVVRKAVSGRKETDRG